MAGRSDCMEGALGQGAVSGLRKLPIEFKRDGSIHRQIKRTEKKALYAVIFEGKTIAYEVIKVRTRQSRSNLFTGNIDPPSEIYPGNEAFGQTGWYIVKEEDALRKYDSI